MIEDVTKSAKGEVRAEDRSVRVERSAVGVVRGKNVEVSQAGLGLVLADGKVSVEQGGIGVALGREIKAGGGGIIGLALAPSLEVQPGGRVLLGLREAAVAGAALGLVAGAIIAMARHRSS